MNRQEHEEVINELSGKHALVLQLLADLATFVRLGKLSVETLEQFLKRFRPDYVPPAADAIPEGFNLDTYLGDLEKEKILAALAQSSGVRMRAARMLGISHRGIRYRLAKLGLNPDEPDIEDE